MESRNITPQEFRAVMGSFAAGVTIVTAIDTQGTPCGLTATAFCSVSMSPPRCLVCIDKRARTHEPISSNGRFVVNILSSGQKELSGRFASPIADKFAGVAWRAGEHTGCPILEGALAWMECQVEEVYAGGDHDIFLGQLLNVWVNDGSPLVYFRSGYSTLSSIV